MLHYTIALNRQITSQTRVIIRELDANRVHPEEEGIIIEVSLVTNGVDEVIYESQALAVHQVEDAKKILEMLVEEIIKLKPNRKIFKESFINELRYIQNTADYLSFEFFTAHYNSLEDFYPADKVQEA